jgi:hypothetical protein
MDKWAQFHIISAFLRIQFGQLKSSNHGNLRNLKC